MWPRALGHGHTCHFQLFKNSDSQGPVTRIRFSLGTLVQQGQLARQAEDHHGAGVQEEVSPHTPTQTLPAPPPPIPRTHITAHTCTPRPRHRLHTAALSSRKAIWNPSSSQMHVGIVARVCSPAAQEADARPSRVRGQQSN